MSKPVSKVSKGDRVPKNNLLDADITSQNQVGKKLNSAL